MRGGSRDAERECLQSQTNSLTMTTEQIIALQSFVSSLKSEITQRQLLVDGAEALLKIATEGYQTDQSFIDAEVQKGKDAVAEQVASLTQERDALVIETNDKAVVLEEKTATIEALQTAYDNAIAEKDALITESVAKDTLIEELQAVAVTLEAKPIEEVKL